MIKLRIDDGEAGEGVEHAAQQGEPLVADHPPQVAKRGQRADGVLEHRHHADAERNQRLGQKRQRPDEHAAQRIKRIAADGRRAEEGVEAVAVQPAAQNPPRFQNEGELLLDEVAPRDKAPAVGQNGRGEGEERQQRAQKKCVRTGDAPPPKRRSLHPCSSLEIGGDYQHNNVDISRIKRGIVPEGFQRAMRQTGAVNVRKALWWGDGAKPHILKMLSF